MCRQMTLTGVLFECYVLGTWVQDAVIVKATSVIFGPLVNTHTHINIYILYIQQTLYVGSS